MAALRFVRLSAVLNGIARNTELRDGLPCARHSPRRVARARAVAEGAEGMVLRQVVALLCVASRATAGRIDPESCMK